MRAGNLFKYPTHALYRCCDYIDPLLSNLHMTIGKSRCDVHHFFNMLSFDKTPWVTTYETSLPRWAGRRGFTSLGLRLMASSACKQLIAMSACADRLQRRYLGEEKSYAGEILPKLTVLHPPQVRLADTAEKPLAPRVRFTFVGADFFRKGGLEVLRAVEALLASGADLQLNIVSRLQYGDYASQTTKADQNFAASIIARYPRNIFHHETLNNAAVLDLLKQSHVALLPTWADTYGYSVLEAQACGCPVITTDIRALPEINNNECGWIIPVEKNEMEGAVIETAQQRRSFSERLECELKRVISEILDQPNLISEKGAKALQRIGAEHDPAAYAGKLEAIYESACSRNAA
jgi:glycosyltransferase involved in cell wall biosynthesis